MVYPVRRDRPVSCSSRSADNIDITGITGYFAEHRRIRESGTQGASIVNEQRLSGGLGAGRDGRRPTASGIIAGVPGSDLIP
jgi:hypothetical protein